MVEGLSVDPYAELVRALTGEELRSLPEDIEILASDEAILEGQYDDEIFEWIEKNDIVCIHEGKSWRYEGVDDIVCEDCFKVAYRPWLKSYVPTEIARFNGDPLTDEDLDFVVDVLVALRASTISRSVLLLDKDGRSRALEHIGLGSGWISGYVNEARFDNEEAARLFSALVWFDEASLPESLSSWYVTVKDPSVHYPLRLPTSETALGDAPKVYSFLESSSDDDVSDQGGAA